LTQAHWGTQRKKGDSPQPEGGRQCRGKRKKEVTLGALGQGSHTEYRRVRPWKKRSKSSEEELPSKRKRRKNWWMIIQKSVVLWIREKNGAWSKGRLASSSYLKAGHRGRGAKAVRGKLPRRNVLKGNAPSPRKRWESFFSEENGVHERSKNTDKRKKKENATLQRASERRAGGFFQQRLNF